MDGKTKAIVGLIFLACLIASCQVSRNITHGPAGTLRPLPQIEGTSIVVPRAWEPEEESRNWKWIVIHHSASDTGGALTFDQWHRKRGFDELGYHFVIDNGSGLPDGNVEVGSRWLKQKYGAHAKSEDGRYNQQGIGICLVGNFEKGQPTARQWEVLVKLVSYISRKYHVAPENIIGHQDVNPKTLCPGKGLSLEKLRKDVEAYPPKQHS
jgi:N-acetyl-anhydromuramyl-L-alanine amidase AmpD